MRLPDPTPLLALVNATAEWHAGVAPTCSASVRLLDRVHFMVHRGDCVVVHHDDPAGARVLLAALGGHHALAPGRRLQGQRLCAPGVRIRRCSVSIEAACALQQGWAAARASLRGAAHDEGSTAGTVVHLLRASRHASASAQERHQWQQWARGAFLAGGALVLVERPESVAAPLAAVRTRRLDDAISAHAARIPEALYESAAPEYSGAAPTTHAHVHQPTATRDLWLHHGQLFNLRRWQ